MNKTNFVSLSVPCTWLFPYKIIGPLEPISAGIWKNVGQHRERITSPLQGRHTETISLTLGKFPVQLHILGLWEGPRRNTPNTENNAHSLLSKAACRLKPRILFAVRQQPRPQSHCAIMSKFNAAKFCILFPNCMIRFSALPKTGWELHLNAVENV